MCQSIYGSCVWEGGGGGLGGGGEEDVQPFWTEHGSALELVPESVNDGHRIHYLVDAFDVGFTFPLFSHHSSSLHAEGDGLL